MESASSSAPHRLLAKQDQDAPVKLLYIRLAHESHDVLDSGLATIVERYAPLVELIPVSPDEMDVDYTRWAQRTPTVLVVRRGKVVGEALGAFLPVRELDRVVRCAIEWA